MVFCMTICCLRIHSLNDGVLLATSDFSPFASFQSNVRIFESSFLIFILLRTLTSHSRILLFSPITMAFYSFLTLSFSFSNLSSFIQKFRSKCSKMSAFKQTHLFEFFFISLLSYTHSEYHLFSYHLSRNLH